MEVPQKKNPLDKDLWLKEIYTFKESVEELSGTKVTAERLKETIKLVNIKRKAMQRINEFRKLDNPPISGLEALLVAQISLNQDISKFIAGCVALLEELQERVDKGISAYDHDGPRVMMAGTPSPMGNAKVHYVVESSGMKIVVDESCTGLRYFRDLVDETPDDLDAMIEAIADRYFKIDCPCFSPNKERIDNILATVKEYNIQGVVQNILQYCHGFNIEAKAIENALNEINIPSLKIVTDYSDEDIEQLRVRTESFAEVIGAKEPAAA
jgi:benzoyl-CoA reductase/2-hydroxyglutaryl-CoA dehydratase subunit BcrC/BadD/HgdB